MRVNNVLLNNAKRSGFLTKVEVISQQAAEVADYQVKAEDIISRKGDGEDITFFQKNIILNHWKESYASWKSDVWSKLPRLPVTKSQILNILSGNPSASKGDNTLDLFDGFDGETLDTDKWTQSYTTSGAEAPTFTANVSDSVLTLSLTATGVHDARGYLLSDTDFATFGYAIRLYGKYNSADTRRIFGPCVGADHTSYLNNIHGKDALTGLTGRWGATEIEGEITQQIGSVQTVLASSYGSEPYLNTYIIFEHRHTAEAASQTYIDDVLQLTETTNTYAPVNNYLGLIIQTSGTEIIGNFGWILVRKCVSPEPLIIKRKISGKAGILKAVCGGICS